MKTSWQRAARANENEPDDAAEPAANNKKKARRGGS
jgi:hypothetical protein